jgi:hypothetical protein
VQVEETEAKISSWRRDRHLLAGDEPAERSDRRGHGRTIVGRGRRPNAGQPQLCQPPGQGGAGVSQRQHRPAGRLHTEDLRRRESEVARTEEQVGLGLQHHLQGGKVGQTRRLFENGLRHPCLFRRGQHGGPGLAGRRVAGAVEMGGDRHAFAPQHRHRSEENLHQAEHAGSERAGEGQPESALWQNGRPLRERCAEMMQILIG